MKYALPLSLCEQQTLEQMYQYHPKRNVRIRSHSILLSSSGLSIKSICQIYKVDRRSVSSWIDRWEQNGLMGLSDKPRSGRRRTFTDEEEKKVLAHLKENPKQIKTVVHIIEEQTGKQTSTDTIKRIAKRARNTWKRIKKVPSKTPDPRLYQRAKQKLEVLQEQEDKGIIDLYYFDASGFSLQSCVPYAWQPIGEYIQVPNSKSKRLNVLGFLNRENDLFPVFVEASVDTSVVVACFEAFKNQIRKKTVVLLDRASVHTSKEFIENIPKWVKDNLIIKYLPPYSPQLNLIEILWRFIKYYWIPFAAYQSFKTLVHEVENIVINFGKNQRYQINFKPV